MRGGRASSRRARRSRCRARRARRCALPVDLGIAEHVDADAARRELDGVEVPDGWMGLDIGPRTAARYARADRGAPAPSSGTGRWASSSSMPFAAGTRAVAQAVAAAPGDDRRRRRRLGCAALAQFGLAARVTHLSTGGGATLELIEGRDAARASRRSSARRGR